MGVQVEVEVEIKAERESPTLLAFNHRRILLLLAPSRVLAAQSRDGSTSSIMWLAGAIEAAGNLMII